MKRKLIAVIGPNDSGCDEKTFGFGLSLGKYLSENAWAIVCGGMGGLMAAVCEGAHDDPNYAWGTTIGIIPGEEASEANSFCDIVIPTGMGIARNKLVVNTGEAVISIGGGAGTLSEIAMAWQLGKPILCMESYGGWSGRLAQLGIDLDQRKSGLITSAKSFEDLKRWIDER